MHRTLAGMPLTTWLQGVFLLAVLAAILLLAPHKPVEHAPQYSLQPGAPDLRASGAVFEKDIREFGGKAAYARLGVAIGQMGIDDQHAYAHEFGHELYKVEGEKGVSVCDSNFGLGCYHQFLGDAIGQLGSGAVQRLYDECAAAMGDRSACEHGLGHGVLAGTGYDEPDLLKAIALCDRVTNDDSYSGCSGGAFMEYNMRTIASAEGTMHDRQNTGDLYAPCPAFEKTADRKTCVFWLPQWWYYDALRSNHGIGANLDAYRQMSRLCVASSDAQSCFEGIGYITPTVTGFDVQQTRSACEAVGYAGNGTTYCLGMAALIFHLTYPSSGQAAAVCGGLKEKNAAICLQYAAHNNGFSFTVPEKP